MQVLLKCRWIDLCVVLSVCLWVVSAADPLDKCTSCTKGVKGFTKGMDMTADKGWTGGDTSWHEERGLLYSTSETRFIEVMEHSCDKKDHNCHSFMSDHEETVEEWFSAGGEGDLYALLCITKAKVCCPENTYGPQCKKCLTSVKNEGPICSGNGKCEGAGKRDGTGVCNCTAGYKGKYCAMCAKGYFRQDDKCVDFDECKHGQSLCTEDEICHNTAGSFECKCKPQYTRQDGKCTADTPAPKPATTPEPADGDTTDTEKPADTATTGEQLQKLASMLKGWLNTSDETKDETPDATEATSEEKGKADTPHSSENKGQPVEGAADNTEDKGQTVEGVADNTEDKGQTVEGAADNTGATATQDRAPDEL